MSMRSPQDASRGIGRTSPDAYKGSRIWRRPSDARAAAVQSPCDACTMSTVIQRGSLDFESGSRGSINSGTPVEQLITLVAFKRDGQNPGAIVMVKPRSRKSGKAQGGSPVGETTLARAGDDDELSTSRRHEDVPLEAGPGAVGGADEISYQKLSKPFTDAQDREIADFIGKHPCFYDSGHKDHRNKNGREALLRQLAHTMFASGKCVFLALKSSVHTVVIFELLFLTEYE